MKLNLDGSIEFDTVDQLVEYLSKSTDSDSNRTREHAAEMLREAEAELKKGGTHGVVQLTQRQYQVLTAMRDSGLRAMNRGQLSYKTRLNPDQVSGACGALAAKYLIERCTGPKSVWRITHRGLHCEIELKGVVTE